MTQRTIRTIESVAIDLEYEKEVQDLQEKHKSKRLNPVENTMADQWKKLQTIF